MDKVSQKMGMLFEFENRLGKLKLVLMILDLEDAENKKQLFCRLSKRDGFVKEMKGNFPRIWRYSDLPLKRELDDDGEIDKKIENWWKSFIEKDLERICNEVNDVLKELDARPEKSPPIAESVSTPIHTSE